MNPFSNNRNAMMHQQSYSAEPYREGMDFTDEAWAYGLRALPGSLANQLQALGEYTTGKDYPNKLGNYLDELTQVNEMGYTPQTEYEAGVAFLPELVYDPALIAGAPYAAYKGIRNAPKLLNTLSDDMLTTPMRNQLGMITWQGSPHKYDGVLDPTKIGTGEGAQAYGYGHYLAESLDVANAYKNDLSDRVPFGVADMTKDELSKMEFIDVLTGGGKDPIEAAKKLGIVRDEEMRKAMDFTDQGIDLGASNAQQRAQQAQELIDWIAENQDRFSSGYLYKFDLDDNAIANMLDWDAPFSDQPEAVRNAITPWMEENILLDGPQDTGGDFIRRFADGFYDALHTKQGEIWDFVKNRTDIDDVTGEQVASDYLKLKNIPGIKYYDGSSRTAGEGTRNFVVFPGNENLVTPLERNGEPLGILPKR